MGSSYTIVPLCPSLVILFLSLDRQRGARGVSVSSRTDFAKGAIETPETEGLPSKFC